MILTMTLYDPYHDITMIHTMIPNMPSHYLTMIWLWTDYDPHYDPHIDPHYDPNYDPN